MPRGVPKDFWDYVEKTDSCWLWKGPVRKDTGYGKCSMCWGSQYAHRAAWIQARGKIRRGLKVLHDCDVKLCVNPKHLYLGTTSQNTLDALNRGLLAPACGEQLHSKLKTSDAKQVFVLHSRGISNASIARKFEIDPSTISRILSGKRWARALGRVTL